jgi:hypothetical protein
MMLRNLLISLVALSVYSNIYLYVDREAERLNGYIKMQEFLVEDLAAMYGPEALVVTSLRELHDENVISFNELKVPMLVLSAGLKHYKTHHQFGGI